MKSLLLLTLCALSTSDLRLPVLATAEPVGDRVIPSLQLAHDGALSRGDALLVRPDAEPGARLHAALGEIAAGMTKKEAAGMPLALCEQPLRIEADAFAPAARMLELFAACARPEVLIWRFELGAAPADGSDDRAHRSSSAIDTAHVLRYELPIDLGVGEAEVPLLELRVSVEQPGNRVHTSDSPSSPFVYDRTRQLGYELNGAQHARLRALLDEAEERINRLDRVDARIQIEGGVTCGELLRLVDALRDAGVGRLSFVAP